ncbi:VIR protein [Plasmodium vivax]|uniref:VIR protein n=1 Tax=Plasmodium vivax TaxID=5855 RepID=A0A1G4ECM3_PLAVI|nr:VIR protein [Plasmodium vivax]
MGECKGHSGDYLTYDCYTAIKNYLKKIKELSTVGKEYLDEGISKMSNKPDDMTEIKPIFTELATFFRGSHAFTTIGKIPTCIYVNYLLNVKLRNLHYYDSKYEFKFFQDFADKFALAESRNTINSCNHDMKYYDEVKWNRIKTLFTLYDNFENFISSIKDNTDFKCNDINFLRNDFNVFIKKHDGEDDKLMEKLIIFKDLLGKKVLQINGNCQNEINYFQSPTKYLQKKNQELEKAAQVAQEKQQRAEEQRRTTEQVQAQERRAEEQERAQPQIHQRTLLTNSPKGEQIQTFKDFSREDSLLEIQRNPIERLPARRHEVSKEQVFTDPNLFPSESLREQTEGLEYLEVRNTGLGNTNMDPALTSGVFGTLKNTFTGVLGEIDPVPVVGVSGGMGALFLLFRVLEI